MTTASTADRGAAGAKTVVLIDGHCYLCQGITRYVIRHDRKKTLRFAALQSPAGQRLLRDGGMPQRDFQSFVLVRNGRYYTKSGAALRVLQAIGGWRSWLFALIVVPAPLRDLVYDWVARNRYRWLGRSDTCLLPAPDVLSRFLEDGR